MRGAICPQAALHHVVSSKAYGVASLPERVVVCLGVFKDQQPWLQVGASQRFCIHKFWWVQYSPGAFRTHSRVVCVEFLLFKKRKKKKKNDKLLSSELVWQPGSQEPQYLGFHSCFLL
jgi:hypothetical protein